MLRILIKKQLTEVFRGYFYNERKGKARSKAGVLGLFLLYALLMVGILGGLFTLLSFVLCEPLVSVQMGWFYFLLLGMMAILLGVFGSVFSTYSSLYLSKDNDLLLSMPIPTRYIILSRLLNVYILGVLYSFIVILPAVIVYWFVAGFTLLHILGGLAMLLSISMLVLVLSCILGWVVAKISIRLKNKSYISVLISIALIALYYFFYFRAQELIRDIIANAAYYGAQVKGKAYLLYLFGAMGEGAPVPMAILVALNAALCILAFLILSRSFLKLATSANVVARVKYKEQKISQKGQFSAILGKELKRFTSSANYMLNCGLGILMLPALGILILIQGGALFEALNEVFDAASGIPAVLLCAALCFAACMNDMAAPSISLEGKSLWIYQSLPIHPRTILRAKLSMQLLLTGIPMLFCLVCVAVSISCNVLALLVPLCYTFFSSLIAMALGLKLPNLTWNNEIVPVKQGASVGLSILFNMVFPLVLAGLYFWFGWKWGLVPYLLLFLGVELVVSLVLYLWLEKKGPELFSSL